ncbi:MAG: hypothetical protein AABX17_03700 [Nanoarchaeota archaeon]
MKKKKKIVKKAMPVKKSKAKKEEVCNCCRQPSNKPKDSKIEKLKKLAAKSKHKKKEKVGFFGRIFGR